MTAPSTRRAILAGAATLPVLSIPAPASEDFEVGRRQYAVEQLPTLWREITRPSRSSRSKQQLQQQKQFVCALPLAEPLVSHNGGSAAF